MTSSVLLVIDFNMLEIELNDILLLFRGRVLKDEQTINQCNITANDTVLLVVHKNPEESRMIIQLLIRSSFSTGKNTIR